MPETQISRQDLIEEARRLLGSLGEGTMSETAYDTAWVARVPNPSHPAQPLFPAAYDWLMKNQHDDGSWGAELPFAHDRLISTLAALVTLASSSYRRPESEPAARKAVVYLNRDRPNILDDPHETVGFELLLPELVRQAQALDLRLPYEDWAFVEAIKADKLQRIPPIAVYGGPTSLTFSIEYLGGAVVPDLVSRCQSPNGSYGLSPSATAYVHAIRADSTTLGYLQQVTDAFPAGGLPDAYPLEVFEIGSVLYHLGPLAEGLEETKPLLDRLRAAWTPMGTSLSREWKVTDADDTAVSLFVLNAFGSHISPEVFELFESQDHFYTYAFERNPSVTTNAHILHILRNCPTTPTSRRMIVKSLHYLQNARKEGSYWVDKWHVSPFYATSQTIAAVAGISNDLSRPAVQWLLDMQRDDGSWGFTTATAEETALAIAGLASAVAEDSAVRGLVTAALDRGVAYLELHFDENPRPALWLSKTVYRPPNIVQAIVLGALGRWTDRVDLAS